MSTAGHEDETIAAEVDRRGVGALTVRELRAETWDDFEQVLGSNGGARGCWCMHWRLSIAEWMEGKGEGNKQAMKELASQEHAPGVLVYDGDQPVAWCSLGPRASFPRLERSRTVVARPRSDRPIMRRSLAAR